MGLPSSVGACKSRVTLFEAVLPMLVFLTWISKEATVLAASRHNQPPSYVTFTHSSQLLGKFVPLWELAQILSEFGNTSFLLTPIVRSSTSFLGVSPCISTRSKTQCFLGF